MFENHCAKCGGNGTSVMVSIPAPLLGVHSWVPWVAPEAELTRVKRTGNPVSSPDRALSPLLLPVLGASNCGVFISNNNYRCCRAAIIKDHRRSRLKNRNPSSHIFWSYKVKSKDVNRFAFSWEFWEVLRTEILRPKLLPCLTRWHMVSIYMPLSSHH